MSFDRRLSPIRENTSTSQRAQKDAKPSRKSKRKTRRDIASLSQGPGGFHNPRGSQPEIGAPTMADADSKLQPEAAAPATEPDQAKTRTSESHDGLRASVLPVQALAASSAHQQQPDAPENAKLDPAGFFTLVNNTNFGASSSSGQQAHHPRVQYIFADDDPAELTAALAHAQQQTASSTDSQVPSRNHGIIVDVAPETDPATGKATGGWKVTSAASISGRFAVTDAQITRMEDSSSASGTSAKAKAGAESEEGANTGGLMLKIEGVEVTEEDAVDARGSLRISQSGDKTSMAPSKDDYPSLLEDFDKNMSMIKKIVAAGEKRANKDRQASEAKLAVDETSQEKHGVAKDDHSGEESG